MSNIALEALIARVYVDAETRRAFLADPVATAIAYGLSASDAERLRTIDAVGLELAARSFARKRTRAEAEVRRGRPRDT